MKPYTVEIEIERSRDDVIELFNSADNLFFWQTGLQSFKHISGNPGEVGAVSLLTYQNGKHNIELTETITHVNLPEEFDGTYEWKSGMNTLVNRFEELGPNRTKWISTCSYEFRSIGLKLMGMLMPGMFKKQNMAFLKNFKAFCESGYDVRESGPA